MNKKKLHKTNIHLCTLTLLLTLLTPTISASPLEDIPTENLTKSADSIPTTKLSPKREDIYFIDKAETAVLIGDSIQLLNDDLSTNRALKEGDFVEITGVSTSLHRYTDEECAGFYFVQVAYKDTHGIIDGRNVYKLKDTLLNLANKDPKHTLIIVQTQDYRQDIKRWDEELITCDFDMAPLVWIDPKTNRKGLFQLIKDPSFNRITAIYADRDFFQFNGDTAYDRVLETNFLEDGILLKVKRSSNREILRYQVLFSKNSAGVTARYVD